MRSLSTLCFVLAAAFTASAAERPSVLLICVDDLKPLLGCYGELVVESPSIDRLARRGVRFEHAYCNQAVCAPSRNSLLTGLRPQTLGIYNLGTNFRKAAPDAVTLPQHFKQQGYHTAGVGKIYHIGHGNHDDAASWSEPHWETPSMVYHRSASVPQSERRGAAFESADEPDSEYPDAKIADEAVRRLQQAAATPDQPFFLAVGFYRPHLPFVAPAKDWRRYDRSQFAIPTFQSRPADAPAFAMSNFGELRSYGNIPSRGELSTPLQQELIHGYHAAVSHVDAQIGRLLDALDAAGLADNTVVVLWGDHGWHLGDHGMWCKHTNYEQATRVPLIVSAPGRPQGAVADAGFVETVDIYPTLCDLTGLPTPRGLDGRSFAAAVEEPSHPAREAAVQAYPRGERIGQAIRTERYRLVEWRASGAPARAAVLELYDYKLDPAETKNVAAEQPEVVAELQAKLRELPEPKPQLR